ncbi:MAG: AcrR family transcriptional regulator [Acidimicrobiales bacterium]|jgi:AcrR family transcriptional regulator
MDDLSTSLSQDSSASLDQRARILESAISILAAEGASALTVRNVASGAGCSTTGVYTYYGGKNGLVDAIFMEGFESFDAALHNSDHTFTEIGLAYRRWALERPTHYQVMFGSAVPEFEPSPEALDRATQSFDGLVLSVINSATKALTDQEARSLAFHIWATVHGYVMLELLGMFPPSLGTPDELYRCGLARLVVDLS